MPAFPTPTTVTTRYNTEETKIQNFTTDFQTAHYTHMNQPSHYSQNTTPHVMGSICYEQLGSKPTGVFSGEEPLRHYSKIEDEVLNIFPPPAKAPDLASYDLTALFNNYNIVDQKTTLQSDLMCNSSPSTIVSFSSGSPFSSSMAVVSDPKSQLEYPLQQYYDQQGPLPTQLPATLPQCNYSASYYDPYFFVQDSVMPIHPTSQQQVNTMSNIDYNNEIIKYSQAEEKAADDSFRQRSSTTTAPVPLTMAQAKSYSNNNNNALFCTPSLSEPIPSQQQQQNTSYHPSSRKRTRSMLHDRSPYHPRQVPLADTEPSLLVENHESTQPYYASFPSNYAYPYTQQQQQQHVELNDQMLAAMPRRQKTRYENDYYTPKWVRYTGHLKEGYCDLCQPGKWLQLKNSAYWYHKQFFHGISSVSGQPFIKPLKHRLGKGDVIEGLCHQCHRYVSACNGKKKNNYMLWYRHAHKCHLYDKPSSTKANTNNNSNRKLSNDTLSTASSVSTIVTGNQSHHLNKGF